jgi:hypothetical protein
MTTTATATPYIGWCRATRRGRWEQICTAATWQGCYDRLLARTRGRGGDRAVLPEGHHPEDQRAAAAK